MSGGDESPLLFFTGTKNFRFDIAKRQPYKQRAGHKPFHYYNIKAYLKAIIEYREVDWLEADDLLALFQTDNTIICSRDKDLLAVPKLHYQWECNKQPSFGPEIVDEKGWIKYDDVKKTLKGVGTMFFYAQCIMGDPTDSIPGLPRYGAKKAFDILSSTQTLEEAFKRLTDVYEYVYPDTWKEELLEQGRLLHMTRELYPDGSPVLWEFPFEE